MFELRNGDIVKEAICFLYEKNVSGALIADAASGRFSDRYIGLIDFSDMVLWCLEVLLQVSPPSCSEKSLNPQLVFLLSVTQLMSFSGVRKREKQ